MSKEWGQKKGFKYNINTYIIKQIQNTYIYIYLFIIITNQKKKKKKERQK